MSEPYSGVKFEAEKVGEFVPSESEKANIKRLVSLRDVYIEHGFLDRNGGNVSFRADLGFIIKSTGVWINKITEEDFVRVTDVKDGKVFYEGSKLPSSECRSHFGIYKQVSTINYIFHAHASEVAEKAGIETKPCCLPVIPYGTKELAEALSDKAKSMSFVIAKGHGIFAFGPTFENTLKTLLDSYEEYRRPKI